MSQQSEKTPSDGNRNEDEDFLDDRDDDILEISENEMMKTNHEDQSVKH
jgi:hypothetical protein